MVSTRVRLASIVIMIVLLLHHCRYGPCQTEYGRGGWWLSWLVSKTYDNDTPVSSFSGRTKNSEEKEEEKKTNIWYESWIVCRRCFEYETNTNRNMYEVWSISVAWHGNGRPTRDRLLLYNKEKENLSTSADIDIDTKLFLHLNVLILNLDIIHSAFRWDVSLTNYNGEAGNPLQFES